MYNLKVQHTTCTNRMSNLRIHDLIAKTAHVSHKNSLRVLIALRAVGVEVDLSADEIVNLPYSRQKSTPDEARACEQAYLRMHETNCMQKYLYEVEQIA